MLAARQYDPPDAGLLLLAHGLPDHPAGRVADLAVRRDQIGGIEIERIDVVERDEADEADRLAALELQLFQLGGLDRDIAALLELVALDQLAALVLLAGLRVLGDHLDAVVRVRRQQVEADAL